MVKQESDCVSYPFLPSPLSLISKLWIQLENNYEYVSFFNSFYNTWDISPGLQTNGP